MNRWAHLLGVFCIGLFLSVPIVYADDNLKFYWQLNEGEGTTVGSSSGYSGTLYGGPTWIPGGGLSFDGVNDYARTDSPLSESMGVSDQAYTLSASVRVNDAAESGNIIHISNGANGIGWCISMLHIQNGYFRAIGWQDDQPVTAVDTVPAVLGEWYSIANTWSPETDSLDLYVNGVKVASTPMTSYQAADEPVYVFAGIDAGGCNNDQGWFKGDVKDVRIYSRAITEEEAEENANESLGTISVETLLPADDATDVAHDTNLLMTFSTSTVHAIEGTVSIYKMDGDELVESIDVTSDGVVPNSAEATIYPSEEFEPETEYYVLVSEGAFADEDGNTYPGITASSTWNFTTAPSTDPVISAERAVSIDKTYARFHGYFLEGEVPFRELGFRYSVSEDMDAATQFGTDEYLGEGNYSLVVEELTCEQTYYFRAYGIDTDDTLWLSSTTKSFTMASCVDPVDEPLVGDDVYNIVSPYIDDDGYFWTSISVADEGRRMVATAWKFDPEAIENEEEVITVGSVLVSGDYGKTWTEVQGLESTFPISSEISADGQKIVVAALNISEGIEELGLVVYTSTNGGLTWDTAGEIHNEILDEWEEGFEMYLLVTLLFTRLQATEDFSSIHISFFNSLYRSTNMGDSWVNLFGTDDVPYFITAFDVSADGESILTTFTPPFFFGPTGESVLISSEDGGETWHLIFVEESEPFFAVSMSDNGRRIFVTKFGSPVMHVSLNGGETWATSTNPDGNEWMYVLASDTGNGVFATAYDQDIDRLAFYYAHDGGLTWAKQFEADTSTITDPFTMYLGNVSGSSNLAHIGLVNMSRLYVITRGPINAPPTPSTKTRQISRSPVSCNATRTSFCRADQQPSQAPALTVASLIAEHRELFTTAHGMGIVLPSYILDMLGLSAPTGTVRDLELGMEGEDVRALQAFLVKQGYSIPAGATGYFGTQTQYALDAYQVDHRIQPRGGYFGPITRVQMKSAGISEIWW